MSKKVAILEGDKTRRFSGVKYLRTKLASGGTCEWVPEDERKLTTKHITKNGTYKASDEKGDYYGYSEVTVNVSNKTTGKDNPATGGDGNEYSVTTDEETGQLKKKVLPSSIKIVGLPTKTSYVDGESINKGGMVVKAYKADGSLYDYSGYQQGAIPLSELEIEPTHADIEESGDTKYSKDGVTAVALMCSSYVSEHYATGYNYPNPYSIREPDPSNPKLYRFLGRGTSAGIVLVTNYEGRLYWSTPDGVGIYTYSARNEDGTSQYGGGIAFGTTANRFSEPFTWADGFPLIKDIIPISTTKPTLVDFTDAEVTGGQPITVKWKRPEDDKELTDTFSISVSSNTEEE